MLPADSLSFRHVSLVPGGASDTAKMCWLLIRSYAAAIVELLDPSGRLFGQRIISQGAAGDGVQQDLTKRLMQVGFKQPLWQKAMHDSHLGTCLYSYMFKS